MHVYDVNTTEYLNGNEFGNIIDFIIGVRNSRATAFAARYPDYKIKPRVTIIDSKTDESLFNHLKNFNVPFYDSIICETLLHKDNIGYIEINEFTYQLNCFSKTIFHRKKWIDQNNDGNDKFLQFIWNGWKQTQQHNKFDALEEVANQLFDSCDNLFDFHTQFVYNDKYKFATVEDIRELFDELVAKKVLLGKIGDLYQIYTDVDYNQAETDAKDRYYSGKISKLDEIHIRGTYKKLIPILKSMSSKLHLIPLEDEHNMFEGLWLVHKFSGRVWFVPQFLAFYNGNYNG